MARSENTMIKHSAATRPPEEFFFLRPLAFPAGAVLDAALGRGAEARVSTVGAGGAALR